MKKPSEVNSGGFFFEATDSYRPVAWGIGVTTTPGASLPGCVRPGLQPGAFGLNHNSQMVFQGSIY